METVVITEKDNAELIKPFVAANAKARLASKYLEQLTVEWIARDKWEVAYYTGKKTDNIFGQSVDEVVTLTARIIKENGRYYLENSLVDDKYETVSEGWLPADVVLVEK